MKPLLVSVVALVFLNSCVFESPFEPVAKIATESKLLGRWEEIPPSGKRTSERLLVLQHSANEYVVEYPVGNKAMFFRAYAVDLAGGKYFQVQLLGTAEGPVKPADRKYHLLKIRVNGDQLEMRTLEPEVLGKERRNAARLNAAFAAQKDNPKLFGETVKFRRLQ